MEDIPLVFHQPVVDASARARKEAERNAIGLKIGEASDIEVSDKNAASRRGLLDVATVFADDGSLEICVKIGDSLFSTPAIIPPSGNAHGVLRCVASRWPRVTKKLGFVKERNQNKIKKKYNEVAETEIGDPSAKYDVGSLSSRCFELSYQVSVLDGVWGEFSRLLIFNPRFLIRNDSQELIMDIKQVGVPDSESVLIGKELNVTLYGL